jgi:cytochrome P450
LRPWPGPVRGSSVSVVERDSGATLTADLQARLAAYSGHGGLSPAHALELLESARARCPVGHSNQLGGFHILFDYEDVKDVHADPDTFSSSDGMFRPVVPRLKIPPTEYDNPEHDEWRKQVFDRALNPSTPQRIEVAVRADCNAAIDAFAGAGSCDLVDAYTDPVPLKAICHILGFDVEKGPQLRALTLQLMMNLADPDGASVAMKALADFGAEEVLDRRDHPRDDFLTDLLNARLWGRPLTQEEVSQAVASLVSGGHQTTVSALSNLLYEVLSRPPVRDRLVANPELIPLAVEESLRLHPPFMGFYRRTTKPTRIRGVPIEEDEHVMLCWATANRDPERWENPDEFDLDRPRKRHLSLGLGLHACIGAAAARMELRVALEELLRRLPDLELEDPDSVQAVFGGAEDVFIPRLQARFTPA